MPWASCSNSAPFPLWDRREDSPTTDPFQRTAALEQRADPAHGVGSGAEMKVRPLRICLYSVLMAVLPSQGNGQTPRQSPLPLAQPLTVASNSEDLKRELLRLQMEMSQTARDMD